MHVTSADRFNGAPIEVHDAISLGFSVLCDCRADGTLRGETRMTRVLGRFVSLEMAVLGLFELGVSFLAIYALLASSGVLPLLPIE